MAIIRIAQAQINTTVGDFSANTSKIINYIDMARNHNADIVTFPELTVCGYPPEDLLLKPHFLEDNRKAVEHIRPHMENMAAVIGYADSSNNKVYNAAALLQNQKLVTTYHKVELPNYGVFDEKRYFTRGSRFFVFELNGIRLALTICEDIWIEGGAPEKFVRTSSADIVLNISASPFHAGKLQTRKKIAEHFARATNAFVCFNNLIGGQDELIFDGGSFLISPRGKLIAQEKRFEESLLITDIEVALHKKSREKTAPSISEATVFSLEPPRHPHPRPLLPVAAPLDEEVSGSDALKEVYQALVLGTKDYVTKNGFQKVVIGLSGGIDSSLTAAVAVDAIGPDNVVGVTMPSHYTSRETLSDAELLAKTLNIQLFTVPIKEIYQTYLASLKDPFVSEEPGVTHENIQARIRGNILMAFSNRFGWLVLTTGNKSEIAVGYCTLYGDMAGGFAVIKDLPKTLVYNLSEYVNESWGREVIPKTVLERPPSAELRLDQKDEDSLPPYPILDKILHEYVEEDKAPDEIIASGSDPGLVNEVARMVDRNEYKRRQAPPGIKITPKAFGKDRRLPITNRYLKNSFS
jgi:NAD+ synthase (glutamine-hydrolysing)